MRIEWPDEWFNEEELVNTPKRIQRFIEELRVKQKDFDFKTFHKKECDEMIVQKNIQFYSLCSHHLLPFSGKVHIGYIPKDGKICGLSKLARAVEKFSARPQLQEILTIQISGFIQDNLKPLGVGVVIEAEHLCMSCRGIEKDGAKTVTSSMLGVFREEPETRHEFLKLVK